MRRMSGRQYVGGVHAAQRDVYDGPQEDRRVICADSVKAEAEAEAEASLVMPTRALKQAPGEGLREPPAGCGG